MSQALRAVTVRQWCVIVACSALVVYALPALRNGFVSLDDDYLIYRNPAVQSLTLGTLFHVFASYDPQLYIPLTFVSYQLTNALFGMQPAAFHLGNLLLHSANAALVFLLLHRLSRDTVSAVCGGVLFALHPLHTEAVLWAASRKDVLSGFFFLLSVHAYMTFQEEGRGRLPWRSILWFLLALVSKISVIVLPALLLLLDWYEGRKWSRDVLMEKVPYVLLCIVFGVIAILGKTKVLGAWGVGKNLLLSAKSTLFYLQQIAVPRYFSVIYAEEGAVTLREPLFLLSLLGVLALIVFVLLSLSSRRYRHAAFGIGWYLLLLVPNSINFWKNGFVFFASDRYAYLASIGVFFLLGWSFSRLLLKIHAWQVHALVLLPLAAYSALLVSRTAVQGRTWRDSEAMYRNVLRAYPNSVFARSNLGLELEARGEKGEAKEQYERAIALAPGNSSAYFNLAAMAGKEGKVEEAVSIYRQMVESFTADELTGPQELRRFFWLEERFDDLGYSADAMRLLQKLLMLRPQFADIHVHLGRRFLREGKREDALRAFEETLSWDPENSDAREEIRRLRAGE